ncbi:MAG: dynamin family protein [Gammaproteobacteria bacterium]|nr:dynamin family protein [Gammaproteobacteria bacterium]NNJ96836.1 dynamin family protein [Gammaproteobacteria bacterium]
MLARPDKAISERLAKLESHLENENPLLLDAVIRFKKLDGVAYRMGLLNTSETYATRIPWWPLVTVLGTFSAGKSSFINHFLGQRLQLTGNQAVDDKFSVICYSAQEESRVLPGIALDSDPRFPFYQMSDEIDKVTEGEGRRIDAYLQMKTSDSEKVSGKIIIDSPGFDADDQRNEILRLTNHIIDISDLVLVFFDARHPEPGAMHDTLEHLVADTIKRNDSEKFLYILNQIDTAAREDNPEAVVAAWQRALAQKGLTAGRFYAVYNEEAAVPIDDDTVRKRFEDKRDADLADIYERIHQVEVERSYRIIGALDHIASDIGSFVAPTLSSSLKQWKKAVLIADAVVLGVLFILILIISSRLGLSGWFAVDFTNELVQSSLKAAILVVALFAIHFGMRKLMAKRIAKKLDTSMLAGNIKQAFLRNTRPLRSLFYPAPVGWTGRSRRTLASVIADASAFVQTMNDRFTNPSGVIEESPQAEMLKVVEPKTEAKPQVKTEAKPEAVMEAPPSDDVADKTT